MSPTRVAIPPTFEAFADRGTSWAQWLDALPRLAADLLDDWALTADGPATHGECALVVPVVTDEGRAAVLKLTWPHWEASTEHVALQRWHGDGAVELLRADPHRFALLLERLEPRDLTTVPDDEACAAIADLYASLHVRATPQVRALSDCVAGWTDRLAALPRSAPVPRRYVEQAVALGRAFAADPATDGTLIHADLHPMNVLAATRRPWLAIDPKPLSGDPHYEPAPLLWNRWADAVGTGDVRWALRRRLEIVCDAAGLDEDRVRHWAVFRVMVGALWAIEDAADRTDGAPPDAAELTRCVTIAKAVQD